MKYHCLAALLLMAAPLLGQRYWIVDSVNPVGADFTDLPPAVAAASHGDTILIRGSYGLSGTDINKAVNIAQLGPGQGLGFLGDVSIHGIPAGMRCSLLGTSSALVNKRITLDIYDNQGSVVLDRMTADVRRISNSAHVVIRVGTSNAIEITNSNVVLQDSWVTGNRPAGLPMAIKLTNSRLTINESVVWGSDANWTPYPLCQVIDPPAPGIVAVASNVYVTGSASPIGGFLRDLVTGCGFNQQAPGFVTTGGTITVDSKTIPPIVTGSATVRTQYFPALNLDEFPFADVRSVKLTTPGPTGSFVALLASVPMPPVDTGIGLLWLDPACLLTLAVGQIDASGKYSLATTLGPNIPPGFPVVFQSVVLTPKPEIVLSSPTVRMALGTGKKP